MIHYVGKQIRKLNRDEGGQSLVFVALVLLVLVAFMAVVVNVGHQVNTKIEIQNTADAAAVSGAAWLARGYNLVAGLNQGMVFIVGTILIILASWIFWTICVGFPIIGAGCATMWSLYMQHAPKAIKKLWGVANKMEKQQEEIVKWFPAIAFAEMERITMMNKPGSIGIPYPFVVSGKPELPRSLTLHLERGKFSDILKKLHIPKKVLDIVKIDEIGGIKGESTHTERFNKDQYADAVDYETKKELKSGRFGRKVEKTVWYYHHRRWNLRKVHDDSGRCIRCERDLQEDETCRPTDWKQTDYLQTNGTCCGQNFVVDEWEFCMYEATVTSRRQSGAPDKTPQPMKLSPLFPQRDWVAFIASDMRKSAEPVFLPGFFNQKNPWGTLGIAQARVLRVDEKGEEITPEPGEMLYEMDWDSRLTKVTALDQIFERLGANADLGEAGEKLKKAAEKMLTH